jgi:hypothetical protein
VRHDGIAGAVLRVGIVGYHRRDVGAGSGTELGLKVQSEHAAVGNEHVACAGAAGPASAMTRTEAMPRVTLLQFAFE